MLIISGEKNLISVNSGSLPTLKSLCGTTMPKTHLHWHHISLLEPMETSSFSNVLPLEIHAELCSAHLVLHTVYTNWHFARSVPLSEPPKTFLCPAPARVPRNPDAIPEFFARPHHTGLGKHIRAPHTNSSGNITLAINN